MTLYLKIGKWDAIVESVQQAIAELVPDVEGLTVDNDLNYPAVEFPDGTPHEVYKRLLNAAGWEAY